MSNFNDAIIKSVIIINTPPGSQQVYNHCMTHLIHTS